MKLILTMALFFLVFGAQAALTASAQTQSDDQKFLAETRKMYSVLKKQGLAELHASVIPNWNLVLKDVPVKDRPSALRIAGRLRFSLAVDATGNIHVSHSFVGPKPAKGLAQAFDSIAKGVDLSVTGFMMTWAPFMMTYLIPDNLDHFVLQDMTTQKVLTYKEREVPVSVVIAKDYEIKELSTPQGTVKPVLRRNRAGFILTGYDANNEDPIVGRVVLNTRIELTPVQGLLLPKTVFLKGKSGDMPISIELSFVNYRLKKRI